MNQPVDLGEADPRPYIRMAARLRRQILAGEIAPGQPVPSLTTLSREFGHARMTCSKAMRLLEQEGLLTFIPGLGYHTASTAEALLRDARHERLPPPILNMATVVLSRPPATGSEASA